MSLWTPIRKSYMPIILNKSIVITMSIVKETTDNTIESNTKITINICTCP